MENKNQKTNEIQVELTDEIAQGTYSNLAIIAHSAQEFIIDFIRVVPGTPKAKVKSRIIMSPDNAKRLLYALQDNIQKFDEMTKNTNNNNGRTNTTAFGNLIGGAGQA